MHTITKRKLTFDDFETTIPISFLEELNYNIDQKNWKRVKELLPESFLQRRIWCMSYKTLKNIYAQRKNHRLVEWHVFLDTVLLEIQHPDLLMEQP